MLSLSFQPALGDVKEWPKIIDAASKSPLGILALALLLITVLALVFFPKADKTTKLAVFLTMFVGLILYGVSVTKTSDDIYRVRVTVLGSDGSPIDDAHVWSSTNGEAMRVSGGWIFVIPPQTKPPGGEMTIFAEKSEAFLAGNHALILGQEKNPTVVLQLTNPRNAHVRGIVEDEARAAVSKAEVSVVGFDAEKTSTGSTGSFELPAHAATDQQVQIHAEKRGFRAITTWCSAGDVPCELILERTPRRRETQH